MNLTSRGKIVLAVLIIGLVIVFTWMTRDTCWVGTHYGSCMNSVIP